MTEILFNTMDVSKMLQVDKSTVKRWTDEGKLKCFRTPGGHRKFRAEDLYQFMSDYSYGISPVNLYPQFASDEAIIRRIITRKEFSVLANVCFSSAIKGKKDEIVKLFGEVYKNGMTLPMLFDEILRPSMKRISDLQSSGKLSAGEVQLASNAISSALVLLTDVIVKPATNGKKAICAAFENEPRDIELKAFAVILESEGYEVLNLGLSASATITQLLAAKQPHLLFVYSSSVVEKESFVRQHEHIAEAAKSCGAKFFVSGNAYASPEFSNGAALPCDKFCSSFKEFSIVQHESLSASSIISADRKN